jgi:hypothetical protein
LCVTKDVEKTLTEKGLSTPQVELKDSEGSHLVDERQAFLIGEIAVPSRACVLPGVHIAMAVSNLRREAMATLEIAAGSDLPRDIDRRTQRLGVKRYLPRSTR